MKFLDLFSGILGFTLGLRRAGMEPVAFCEIEPFCQQVIKHHEPQAPIYSDITEFPTVDFRSAGVDLICGGFPCFGAGTMVLTRAGFVPIETIVVGTDVLTHKGDWKPVTAVMRRVASETLTIKAQGCPTIRTTNEHPFFTRKRNFRWINSIRSERRQWAAPEWVNAGALTKDHFAGQVLPSESTIYGSLSDDFLWLVGRYLGDGWRIVNNGKGRVIICCSHDEADELEERIKRLFACSRSVERTVVKFHITRQCFYDFLAPFGDKAHGKRLPGWVFELCKGKAEALLSGYLSADGTTYRNRRGEVCGFKATTTSRALALGIALLSQRARGVVASIHETTRPKQCAIEGRVVNQRDTYEIAIPNNNRSAFVEMQYAWKRVVGTTAEAGCEVFNLSVQDDESYVADGCIVHNCQDISTAGKGAGLNGARSGLWWQMRRVIGDIRPRWLLIENVPSLRTRGADEVIASLEEIGYTCWPLVVGAWAVGAPHRRNRVWIVAHRLWFWQRGRKRQSERRLRAGDSSQAPGQDNRRESAPEPVADALSVGIRQQSRRRRRASGAGAAVSPESNQAVPDADSATKCTGSVEAGGSVVEAVQVGSESSCDSPLMADSNSAGLNSQRLGGIPEDTDTQSGDDLDGCGGERRLGGTDSARSRIVTESAGGGQASRLSAWAGRLHQPAIGDGGYRADLMRKSPNLNTQAWQTPKARDWKPSAGQARNSPDLTRQVLDGQHPRGRNTTGSPREWAVDTSILNGWRRSWASRSDGLASEAPDDERD